MASVQSSTAGMDLGQAFWEYRSAKIATFVTCVYVIAVMTLFSHSVTSGTFFCPLSRCEKHFEYHPSTETLHRTLLGMSALFVFFDIFVIAFHFTHAVHPKYIVTRFRRWVMMSHVISGGVQCVLGPVAWVMLKFGNAPQATDFLIKGIVVWCFLIHFTTAMFLARTPFGAVRVMMPAFIYVIAMYGYTLGELLEAPDYQLEGRLLQWFVMMHIYVMNRITFALLTKLNVLADVRYTISILLGTAVCAPASMGVASVAFLYGAIVIFNLAFFAFHEKNHDPDTPINFSAGGGANQASLKNHFVQPEGLVFAKSLRSLGADHLTSHEVAALVFDKLDHDRSGYIDLEDLVRLLVSWGLPSYVGRQVIDERDSDGDGKIGRTEFHDHFADVWHFAATVVLGNVEGLDVPKDQDGVLLHMS